MTKNQIKNELIDLCESWEAWKTIGLTQNEILEEKMDLLSNEGALVYEICDIEEYFIKFINKYKATLSIQSIEALREFVDSYGK